MMSLRRAWSSGRCWVGLVTWAKYQEILLDVVEIVLGWKGFTREVDEGLGLGIKF